MRIHKPLLFLILTVTLTGMLLGMPGLPGPGLPGIQQAAWAKDQALPTAPGKADTPDTPAPGKADQLTKAKAYFILPKDSKAAGMTLDVAGRKYQVRKPSASSIESCRIISQNNLNSKYWISLKPQTHARLQAQPIKQKDFHGLILKGDGFTLVSSGHGAQDDVLNSISLYADASTAKKVAGAFGVSLQKRKHPGYLLQTRFVFDPEVAGPKGPGGKPIATLEITNLGQNTVIFQDGGMNRGMRNNQFSFAGFKNNKPMADQGSPVHFGGISVYVTLAKGETFRKKIDLSKWFDLSKPGYYDITGTFYLEFHGSTKEYRVLWTDYVAARIVFSKK
jgi:hypothetical protein